MRQGLLIGFLKKIIWRGKRAILGLKTARPHNFGSAVRGFFEVQESQEVQGNYVSGFAEKESHLGQMSYFKPENGACS